MQQRFSTYSNCVILLYVLYRKMSSTERLKNLCPSNFLLSLLCATCSLGANKNKDHPITCRLLTGHVWQRIKSSQSAMTGKNCISIIKSAVLYCFHMFMYSTMYHDIFTEFPYSVFIVILRVTCSLLCPPACCSFTSQALCVCLLSGERANTLHWTPPFS